MRKLSLLLAITLSTISYSQTWKFGKSGNVFDGEYKFALVIGNGNDFPYNTPKIVFNKMLKNNSFNLYIGDAGYFNSSENVKALFIFDNQKDTIFSLKKNKTTLSKDGKTVFLNSFVNDISKKDLDIFQFMLKLKSASKLNIRISNNYGTNDLAFSLKGSSKAISNVISIRDLNEIITIKINKEKTYNNKVNYFSRLLGNYDLNQEESKKICDYLLSKTLGFDINEIDSLNITSKNDSFNLEIKILNQNNEEILNSYNVFLPEYSKKLKLIYKKNINKLIDKEGLRIRKLVNKYTFKNNNSFNSVFKEKIFSIASYSKEKYPSVGKFYLKDIDSFGIIRKNRSSNILKVKLYNSKGELLYDFPSNFGLNERFVSKLKINKEY